VTGRRERRGTQLLDEVKETRRYWKLRGNTNFHTVGTRFGRGYGPVVRETKELMSTMCTYNPAITTVSSYTSVYV